MIVYSIYKGIDGQIAFATLGRNGDPIFVSTSESQSPFEIEGVCFSLNAGESGSDALRRISEEWWKRTQGEMGR